MKKEKNQCVNKYLKALECITLKERSQSFKGSGVTLQPLAQSTYKCNDWGVTSPNSGIWRTLPLFPPPLPKPEFKWAFRHGVSFATFFWRKLVHSQHIEASNMHQHATQLHVILLISMQMHARTGMHAKNCCTAISPFPIFSALKLELQFITTKSTADIQEDSRHTCTRRQ